MVEVHQINWEGGTMTLSCTPGGWHDDIERYELLQFIGLRGKNGREIYVGDIMREPNNNQEDACDWDYYEVKFGDTDEDRYGFYLDGSFGDQKPYTTDFLELEVVGNIYKNPELIKLKQEVK